MAIDDRLLEGLVLNIEGFEDERYVSSDGRRREHVSAYSKSRNIEAAVLNHRPDGVVILLSRPIDSERDEYGFICTPSDTNITRAVMCEYDPLVIRCVVLELLKEVTHGGNDD